MSSTASLSLCLTRFAEGGVRGELLSVASLSLSAYRARFRGEAIAIENAVKVASPVCDNWGS